MSRLNGNHEITAEQSAAYNAAKGAAGEQPLELDIEDDDRHPCACRDHFLYGPPDECPACHGSGFTDSPNEWCDACGLYGNCRDCDGDAYDRANDR